jgi:hypothetical protein
VVPFSPHLWPKTGLCFLLAPAADSEVASLSAVTLSPMALTTLISPGGSLCSQISRVENGAPGVLGAVSQGNRLASGTDSWNFSP